MAISKAVGPKDNFGMLELAMMLTPSLNAPQVAQLIALIPGGEDRCKEYLSFCPIQFLPAHRLRIVEPIFCYCPHAVLSPWIPMLSLACHYDPEAANVLLDSVLNWWVKAIECSSDFLSPMMRYFGKELLIDFEMGGYLDDVEKVALYKLTTSNSFWDFDGSVLERLEKP